MSWVLKRTVSMRRFIEHTKHTFKLMDKKVIAIYFTLFFVALMALWKADSRHRLYDDCDTVAKYADPCLTTRILL